MNGKDPGCSPEMARRIVALLMADPNVVRPLVCKPPSKLAAQERAVPRVKAALRMSPEAADAAFDLALRVRSACVLKYGSLAEAEKALGVRPKSISNAACLEPDRIRSQLKILRDLAKRLEIPC